MRLSKLMMPAVLTVGALALAGCGGGSDTPAATQPPPPTPEEACTERGGTWSEDTTPMCTERRTPPTALDRADTLNTATRALNDLAGAADADGSALKRANDAHEKAMNFAALKGVSADVEAYGQKVLDARKALADALTAAEMALTAARTAATGATGATKRILDDAIESAEKAIEAGEARRDEVGAGTLRALALGYTGEGNTPAEKASNAAQELYDLGDLFGDAPNSAPPPSTDFPADRKTVFADGNTIDSATMMKFTEFFTTEKIPSGTQSVDAAPVNPTTQMASITSDEGDGRLLPLPADGTATAGHYFGIQGDFHRRGEGDEAKWYFVPDAGSDTDYYVLNSDGTGYQPASYVEWGLWLTTDSASDIDGVSHFFAGGSLRDSDSINGIVAADGKDVTATYTGDAAGLSARKTGEDEDETYHSGHFAATVELTATFKAANGTDTLDGSIHTFRPTGNGTDHVDQNWRLNFIRNNAFDGDVSGGYEGDGAPTGQWHAIAYGGTGTANPEGIYGAFHAGFKDGKVTGVYHAD